VSISDDEARLLALYRALHTNHERDELLRNLTNQRFFQHFPEGTVYDHMPCAGGVEPSGHVHDRYSLSHILYSGIEETGEPSETLFGTSTWDKDYAIPRFAAGATAAASYQGSLYNYGVDFAEEYIPAWRWEIVGAIQAASRAEAQHAIETQEDE
jgi:hypothetical protein